MDVQMPVMDGLEATRRLRANPTMQRLPVLALTANASREDERICREAGMNDFISKPVRPAVLYSALLRNLGLARDENASFPSEKVGAGGTAIFDNEAFIRLAEGNPERARRLADAFATSARRTLDELDEAMAQQNAEMVGRLGHKLKSSAYWVGAIVLGDMARCLEDMGPGQRIEACRRLQPELQMHVDYVLREMQIDMAINDK